MLTRCRHQRHEHLIHESENGAPHDFRVWEEAPDAVTAFAPLTAGIV